MTDQSIITSLLASVTSWLTTVTVTLTPATLFLLLNLVIGTIAVTVRFTSKDKPQHQLGSNDSHGQRQIARVPSLLDRVKSFKFSLHKFPNHEHEHEDEDEPTVQVEPELPPRLARAPSLLERLKSIRLTSAYISEESETETEVIGIEGAETNTVHKPTRRKSETKKQKPMTEEETEMTVRDGDDDVDAKADDFINKFKRQLRLQRLDSLSRYKEMLMGK